MIPQGEGQQHQGGRNQVRAPTSPQTLSRAQELLLEFLRDHDASCPVCGYNLRALTRPVCPECKQDLVITVGVPHLRLGWLFIALVPGFFSGVAACFALFPTLGIFFEDGFVVWPFVGAVLFGWCSGIFAIMLAWKRNRFIKESRDRQRWFALLIWLMHFLAFVALVASFAPYWN